ncbi:hypothetical protein Emag_001690 [Eimeria magna]
MIDGPCDTISPEVVFKTCEWSPGTTVYLRRVIISQVVQDGVETACYSCSCSLAWNCFEYSGPIIPVSPDTGMLEEKFLIGTADPTRGSPSASEFQIITMVSFKLCHLYYNWAGMLMTPLPAAGTPHGGENREKARGISQKIMMGSRFAACIAFDATGTVKHPHLLQMALAIVRQHQIYIASGSGFGLDSESEFGGQPPKQEVPESPEEGEEPELQERRQKRRHEGGGVTFTSEHSELSEQQAGKQNLEELKATLQSKESVLMTTAFML